MHTISEVTDLTPDDQLEDAYKKINASLASDLLSEVLKISPYTFEKLVVDLLSKMGYGTVAYGSHATVASGDGERLTNLMIEYNFCVSTRKTFEIKAIDTDALAEYQDE